MRRLAKFFLVFIAGLLVLAFSLWLIQHNVFVAPVAENDDTGVILSTEPEQKEPVQLLSDIISPITCHIELHSIALSVVAISFLFVFLTIKPDLSPRSPPLYA